MPESPLGVSRTELASWLSGQPGFEAGKGVPRVSSYLVRAMWEGERTIALGCDVSPTIAAGAAVDLIAWQVLSGAEDAQPVTMIACATQAEAVDVIRTVRDALNDEFTFRLVIAHRTSGDGIELKEDSTEPFDFSASKQAVGWAPMLERARTAKAEGVAADLAAAIADDRLRYYPMLSGSTRQARWSVRLDGLEVGQVTAKKGHLRVGGRLKNDMKPSRSRAARAWRYTSKTHEVHFGDWGSEATVSVAEAAETVKRLIAKFPGDNSAVNHGQPEHGLESHVVRGLARVTADGLELDTVFNDPIISRGSQFPTQWSEDGRPKHLDALLHNGEVPWAVELKVGRNAGAYYRHGIAQAVLYRHFIRTATRLHPWFTASGLDPKACRAALAFPHGESPEAHVDSLRRVAQLLDVAVCEITNWV